MTENCANCKYLYRMKELVRKSLGIKDWKYSYGCLLFPMLYPCERDSFGLIINNIDNGMCEMFSERKVEEDD